MTILAKLRFTTALVVLMLLLIGATLAATALHVRAALRRFAIMDGVVSAVIELDHLTYEYIRAPGPRVEAQWQSRHVALDRLQQELQTLATRDSQASERLRRSHAAMGELFRQIRSIVEFRSTNGPSAEAAADLEERLTAQLMAHESNLMAVAIRLKDRMRSELVTAQRTQVTVGLLAALIAAGAVLSKLWIVRHVVLRPLGRLQEGIETIAAGQLDHRVPVEGKDEIGEVGEAFNRMAERLRATMASRDDLNREVAERKRAEAELAESNAELERRAHRLTAINKELESFSYSVSHDLRSPLRSIDGFSQAVVEECRGSLSERGREYLARVRANAQRMGQLIDALLQLSRLSRADMHVATVDLSGQARDILAELQEQEPGRSVETAVADGVKASGDPALLGIALQNLLGNAWKFTARQPRARVEFGMATAPDGGAAYVVRDNGAGFDMAFADRLFGAFQRLHSDSEFPGMGIGLATVQRIVHRHGGRIWAESKPGKGSSFYFTLKRGP